jgi:hypothetical protein
MIFLFTIILMIQAHHKVDKPVVSESKSVPPVPYSALLPKPLPDSSIDLPNSVTKNVETVKPMAKKPKAKPTVNSKGKKNARLISRMDKKQTKNSCQP